MQADNKGWNRILVKQNLPLSGSIKYDGIRPAPSYPSQPCSTEKGALWKLLKAAELAGMELTSHYAMMPASSVSALCFAHPQSEYFAVGEMTEDQIKSYAERTGQPLEVAERWLSQNLAYEKN